MASGACSQSKEEALQQLLDTCGVGQGEEVGNEGAGSIQSLQEGSAGMLGSWLPLMEGLTKAAGHNTMLASACAGTRHKPTQEAAETGSIIPGCITTAVAAKLWVPGISPRRCRLRSRRPRWQQRPGPGSTACRSRRC